MFNPANPKPIPFGCKLVSEVSIQQGKYIIRCLHHTDEGGTQQRWQALRYGDDWEACPYPEWRPENNILLALFFEAERLRDKLAEFTKLENYAASGRFNPENGAFDAISFATFAIEGKDYA